MAFIGNILWFFLGFGWLAGLLWVLFGLLSCMTVIGIPFGIACFRISAFVFCPFGKELVPAEMLGEKTIPGTAVMNILWCVFFGFWLALINIITGIVMCTGIITLPFALAYFKIASMAFAPLGKRVVSTQKAYELRTMYSTRCHQTDNGEIIDVSVIDTGNTQNA
jgi:uncharacterized membrane protein YccF (DUF307 family)